MQCPVCLGKTAVYDSRLDETKESQGWVRRRRECLECGHRFKTVEVEEKDLQDAGAEASKKGACG